MKPIALTLAALSMAGALHASTISVNFTGGNANEQLETDMTAGLAGYEASHWNNTSGPSGAMNDLVDSTGFTTSASVSWSSPNTWGDGSATGDANAMVANARLVRGYIDDGWDGHPTGADFTVTGISYSTYTAILYLSTGADGGIYNPFNVNGNEYSTTGNKSTWGSNPNLDDSNTIVINGLSGDLVVDGLGRQGGNRGPIAGFQIVGGSPIPEPSSAALLGLGGLALTLRRRK
ncbi:PEP-CTERM sorting domain-containing protein [Sulfuriroseicoccus oceanibius]|uniref:PEP-CTERM sorting domain-containing protein n=1 Tax=Sulfuriroseicoccus oceanibius TaxID=2707525 RepID=A0A6B3LCI1_9BACT|nr:PEP-CTERM sorting domain-containing protein [Sulfuriroseicoccus oceanibius]QQL45254.1 PEP-CTERM sorting domain-containing protein [Sulfuriroseicoccus oceanibius]